MRLVGRARGAAVLVAVVGATMFSSAGLASAQGTDAEARAACTTAVGNVVTAANLTNPTAAQRDAVDDANAACGNLTAENADFAGILTTLNTALAAPAVGADGADGTDGEPGDTTGTATVVARCREAVAAVSGATTSAVTQANALCDGLGAGDDFASILAALQAGVPTTTTAPSVVAAGFDCSDFADQAEAQAALAADPTDPDGLDADDDGVACESTSSALVATASGYPSGGVASGDGSTEGLDLGEMALLAMVGTTALAGAARVALARAGKVA